MKDYKDLIVWQKAYDVALSIAETVDELSQKSNAVNIIMSQVIRSATSVCSNIAEGYGSDSNPEFGRYLGIAYKSALETDNWIQLLKGFIKKKVDKLSNVEQQNLESIKMLIALKKKVQNSPRKKRFEKNNKEN